MYIKVRVKTGVRKIAFVKTSEDHFEIAVREKAERNQANQRVRELIASHFCVPIGKVRIVKGHTSPSKILSVITVNQ